MALVSRVGKRLDDKLDRKRCGTMSLVIPDEATESSVGHLACRLLCRMFPAAQDGPLHAHRNARDVHGLASGWNRPTRVQGLRSDPDSSAAGMAYRRLWLGAQWGEQILQRCFVQQIFCCDAIVVEQRISQRLLAGLHVEDFFLNGSGRN